MGNTLKEIFDNFWQTDYITFKNKIETLADTGDETAGQILSKLLKIEQTKWNKCLEGYLAAGKRPSKFMIKYMSHLGVKYVVSLLSEKEGSDDLRAMFEKEKIEMINFPMHKAKPVESTRFDELCNIFIRLKNYLEDGGKTYIHCSAGLHRTGMILYAFLRYVGKSDIDARNELPRYRELLAKELRNKRISWVEDFLHYCAS